jgi:hypothetical protein
VADAIQLTRPVPVVGKQIAAQNLYVPGQSVGAKAAYRAAHAFIGGFFVVGPHQANDLALIRRLEELGKERASQKTG